MTFPHSAFKIAAQLIEQRLQQRAALPQGEEPADLPEQMQPIRRSALSLLGHDDRVTAKEPAPKIVTDSGSGGQNL